MNSKKDVEVVINNKVYTICGYESEEYLQKIASYLNHKYVELKQNGGYGRVESDLKNILMEINIADDYFKCVQQSREMEHEMEEKDKEIFQLKHELIEKETKIRKLESQLKPKRK